MKKSIRVGFLISSLAIQAFPGHCFAGSKPGSSCTLKPALQWKYGWEDGNAANTVGKPSAKSPIPSASTTLSSGYAPANLAAAYGFDLIGTNGNGTGETIAIVDAYGSPNLQSDLNTFNAQYGLPPDTLTTIYPKGKPRKNDSGWAGETTLDVEWAHAIAPGASIIVVVAPDDSLGSLLSAVTYAASNANVVSMSWSTPEFPGQIEYDPLFAIPGVTFVAASGDSGAGVNWPASSPNVLGVGGTTLTYDSNSGVVSEVGWSNSGGGISAVEQLPAYQIGWNVTPGRGVPDVSYDADPYTGVSVYFTDPTATNKANAGGWYVFGGTSIGTPQWAALVARRASLGTQGTNSFNTVLYANADVSYSTILNDITEGFNGYRALSGYDLVTGLGTPIANQVVTLPNALPTPVPTPTPAPTPIFWHGPAPIVSPVPLPSASPTPPHDGGGNHGGYPPGGSWWSQLANWFNNWFGNRGSGGSSAPGTPTPTPSPTPEPTPVPSPTATPFSKHHEHFGDFGKY